MQLNFIISLSLPLMVPIKALFLEATNKPKRGAQGWTVGQVLVEHRRIKK